MPSKNVMKLKERIKNDLNIDVDENTFRRTRAGYWQRRSGAWVWSVDIIDSIHNLGSCQPMYECLEKKRKLVLADDGEIFAE